MPGKIDLTLDLSIVSFKRQPTSALHFDQCTVSVPKCLLSGTADIKGPTCETFCVAIPAVVVERSHPDLIQSGTVCKTEVCSGDRGNTSVHSVIDLTGDSD